MSELTLLLFHTDPEFVQKYRQKLENWGYRTLTATHIDSLSNPDLVNRVNLFLLSLEEIEDQVLKFASNYRKNHPDNPFQMAFLIPEQYEPGDALIRVSDDFIRTSVLSVELKSRVDAARIRYEHQKSLYEEREFFRHAVRQEEELSSKILEHHINLKKAFKDIEDHNHELVQSNQKLEKIAKFDMLSGLLNRMSLFALIDVEIERSIRTQLPLSGIMLDVDHFKRINDSFGHQFGDEVIRMIGATLKKSLRKYDAAGRYGGEEFFILLPNSNQSQALMIAERFRKELESTPVYYDDDSITITASLGIAEFHPDESKEMWLRRTDKAMYQAKSNGRNSVVVESS